MDLLNPSAPKIKYSEQYADFIIHCSDGDVPAHRFMLSLLFGFFRDYLSQCEENPAKDVKVDFHSKDVRYVLSEAYENYGYMIRDVDLDTDYLRCLNFFHPLNNHISIRASIRALMKFYENENLGIVEDVLVEQMKKDNTVQTIVCEGSFPTLAKIVYSLPHAPIPTLLKYYPRELFNGVADYDVMKMYKELKPGDKFCAYIFSKGKQQGHRCNSFARGGSPFCGAHLKRTIGKKYLTSQAT